MTHSRSMKCSLLGVGLQSRLVRHGQASGCRRMRWMEGMQLAVTSFVHLKTIYERDNASLSGATAGMCTAMYCCHM